MKVVYPAAASVEAGGDPDSTSVEVVGLFDNKLRVLDAPEGRVTLSDRANDPDGCPEDMGPGELWDIDVASKAED